MFKILISDHQTKQLQIKVQGSKHFRRTNQYNRIFGCETESDSVPFLNSFARNKKTGLTVCLYCRNLREKKTLLSSSFCKTLFLRELWKTKHVCWLEIKTIRAFWWLWLQKPASLYKSLDWYNEKSISKSPE